MTAEALAQILASRPSITAQYVGSSRVSWGYRKWSNGTIEAWRTLLGVAIKGTEWNNGIYYYEGTREIEANVFDGKSPQTVLMPCSGTGWWPVSCSISSDGLTLSYKIAKAGDELRSFTVSFYAKFYK